MEVTLVDTKALLVEHLGRLTIDIQSAPLLYFDLEGDNLSRHGTLSLVTVMSEADHSKIKLVDVTVLGSEAFSTANSGGHTLKSILESPDIAKVFFDIRNDSDALFSLFGIRVQGIQDLQLMELASRGTSKRIVNGLAKCIERDAKIGWAERSKWQKTKSAGQAVFKGSFSVFDARPLPENLKEYCAQDVALMPHLRQIYREKLCDAWWDKISQETKARIMLSQSPGFIGQGRHMAEGPPSWRNWAPTPAQLQQRSFLRPSIYDGHGQSSSLQASAIDEMAASAEQPSASDPVAGPSSSSKPGSGNEPTALEGERSATSAPEGTFSLAEALRRAMDRPVTPSESDEDISYGARYYRSGYAGLGYGGYESDDFDKDLTACDKECGYCGRCPY